MSRLIIKNLKENITERHLKESIEPSGRYIVDLSVELVFFEGEFCRLAFIDFRTEEDANAAIDYLQNNDCLCFSLTEAIQCTKPNKWSSQNPTKMEFEFEEEMKLNKAKNAWIPTIIVKKDTKVNMNKNEEELKTEELIKNVRSILNKITPDNITLLTNQFKALPINTIKRLEKTVDLVFEVAIDEYHVLAQCCGLLCSNIKTMQVNCGENNKKTFKELIIRKCQSVFEFKKPKENSCKENVKEIKQEYDENERRLCKRFMGNCRFIGELFKQKLINPIIILYCINNLITKHEEKSLECLCNLLKTTGPKLEQTYNLNETFDKLKALTSKEIKLKIPPRIQFMIQDVIDLRKNKWIPRCLSSYNN